MSDTQRRTFLKSAGMSAATLACGARLAQAAANEKINLAVIGTGGMGSHHLRSLLKRNDIVISYLCDVDQKRLEAAKKIVESDSVWKPASVSDMRQVYDDKSVDAVMIATPDHWHVPAAILALDAGKHVYVEKPCSHNIREGRLLADAVQRSGKVLQVGTQSRSTDVIHEAVQRIREGEIGEVLVAKAWNSQRRGSIGKKQPTSPPAHLDYDQWIGPAPMVPYQSNRLHAIWRWWYHFGCGDIGNDGVHDIDVALWGLGVETHAATVTCLGGKYFFDDDQQFPDTQYAVAEYPAAGKPEGRRKQLIFEQRDWSPYRQEEYENGAAFYGTKGMLVLGHTKGWKLYGPRNKLLSQRSGPADLVAHHQNFFDCIRDRSKQPNASITAGHLAATYVHLANIAARMQSVLQFDPETETITNHAEANKMVRRNYRDHWAVPKNVSMRS